MKTIGKHMKNIRKPLEIDRKSIGGTLGFLYEKYKKSMGKHMKNIGKHVKTIRKPLESHMKSIGVTL